MHIAGTLPLACQLACDSSRYQQLAVAKVVPSSTGHTLLLQPTQQLFDNYVDVLATCTPVLAAAALSSNDSGAAASNCYNSRDSCSSSSGHLFSVGPSLQCLAATTIALAPVDVVLTAAAAAAPGESSNCGSLAEFLPRCRAVLKHLHLLLQQQRVRVQVARLVAMPQQQQQEIHELLQLATNSKQKGSRKAGGQRACYTPPAGAPNAVNVAQSNAALGTYCWAVVAVELLPRCLFQPCAPVSSTTLLLLQQQQPQQLTLLQEQLSRLWSLPAAELEFPPDTAAAAINCLVEALQNQELLLECYRRMAQTQDKLAGRKPASGLGHDAARDGLDYDSESDTDNVLSGHDTDVQDDLQGTVQQQQERLGQACPQQQQQQLQQAGASTGRVSQYCEQLELLRCPDTAAAAAADVRQSMFDFVDSQPWQLEAQDPTGLTCELYRYQRRALAWMLWREQQQQQQQQQQAPPVCSSTFGSTEYMQAAHGVFSSRLLNPLWTKVVLTAHQKASQQEAGVDVNAQLDTAGLQQQQQQQVVIYHAASHGLVSLQRPAAYAGPPGGMLCDEMGIGKTVEVFALILAHPPPANILGKKALGAPQEQEGEGQEEVADVDSDDSCQDIPLLRLPKEAKKRRLQTVDVSKDADAEQGQAAAAAAGSTTSWPTPGKWAGATLVVTPPAILQQWVSEAHKRTSGLQVQVYDGLKWQRAQSEAAARKEAGRQSKGAREAAAAAAAWQYMVDGPPDAPVFDAAAEASAAVAQLLSADVVLTTYDVLQQEVYFSGGNSERLSSLRHKKRYKVPQSPLLQVCWWRLVFDEAQQVGPLSNTAVMAGYLQAKHRWVVTGTPIGAGGLADVGNLLRLINASPFDETHTFRSAIERPFYASVEAAAAAAAAAAVAEDADERAEAQRGAAVLDGAGSDEEALTVWDLTGDATMYDKDGDTMAATQSKSCMRPAPGAAAVEAAAVAPVGKVSAAAAALSRALVPRYGRRERDGVRRLLALLQPLMWRTSKAVADLDHPLPPRHLQCASLRFSPAERSFYDHILEKTAAAKKEMEQRQQQQQQHGHAAAATVTAVATSAAGGAEAAAAAAEEAEAAAAEGKHAATPRPTAKRGRGRGKGGKGAKGPQDLQQLAADQIAQLRRACVHPQLTSYWKELSHELQLQRGGALSIAEILGRMRDATQLKLQAAERELCALLNARASILMAQADEAAAATAAAAAGRSSSKKGSKKRRRSAGSSAAAAEVGAGHDETPAAGVAQDEDGDADDDWQPSATGSKQRQQGGGSTQERPKKRVRFAAAGDAAEDAAAEDDAVMLGAAAAAAGDGAGSSGGSSKRRGSHGGAMADSGEPPEALQGTAWKLLEDSWAVAQHGIRAILPGSSQQDLEPLGDISGGDATWKAWKLVELHTAQLAAKLAASRRQAAEAAEWEVKVSKKQEELLETPMLDEAKARTKLDKHLSKVHELEQQLRASWAGAEAAGCPLQDMTGSASAEVWLASLTERLSAAKAQEQSSRQQVMQENGPAVLTTVLSTQHVAQQLDSLEGAAATDRALLEGIVGGQFAEQLLTQLHSLESTLNAAATAGSSSSAAVRQGPPNRSTAGAGSSAAMGGAGPMKRHRVRFAAAAAADSDYDPEQDSDVDLEADGVDQAAQLMVADAAVGDNRQPQASRKQLQQAADLQSAGAAQWARNSNFSACQQQQQQQQQQHGQAEPAVDPAAAAQTATHQFLDCLPERRVLWRVMFKGTVGPLAGLPGPVLQRQEQQQLANSSDGQLSQGLVAQQPVAPDPTASAAALSGLLSVYTSTAFAGGHTAAAAAGDEDRGAAALQSLQSFQSRLQTTKGAATLRQLSRQLQKKHAAYLRSVAAAVATADAAESALAATAAEAAAASRAAAVKVDAVAEAAAAAAEQAAAKAAAHVNVPRVLQALPPAAVAAAAESARLRVELCRLHKDVHQAELRLEVALHNKQQAQEEAAAAAAGQTAQALALADKSLSELARAAADATKKCDELARHKRFLDNQASESQSLADAAKRKRASASAAAAAAAGVEAGQEDEEGDVECAVCRSPMSEELQVFSCGHYYCDECAQQALSVPRPTCPYCRKAITRNGVFRVSLGGAGGLHEPEVDPPEGPAVRDIKVTGSWMTKIEALLRRLLHMRSNDPTAKALVFSQYPDALALISKALNVVQLDHVSLGVSSGRQAVRDAIKKFSENPDVCVFLLSLRAGSAGLTLTAATRVYLLEPAMDPAIEQQAVARVHRIGQEKEVVITRLLVTDTVEEEVLKTSEAKQALLVEKEAAHNMHLHHHHHLHNHHHHHHHKASPAKATSAKQQQHAKELQLQANHGSTGPAAAAAAGGGAMVVEPHSSGAAAAADEGGPTSPRQQLQRLPLTAKKRRHSAAGGAAAAAAAAAGSAPVNAITAPPLRKEPVGREEAVGLLQALMKQREGG